MIQSLRFFGCIGLLLLLMSGSAYAETPQAKISWTANQESDVIGYRVYQTRYSGIYDTAVHYDIGNRTTVTITLPQARCNATYYWVVTAVDAGGQESGPSQEVFKTIVGSQNWIGACKH